MPATGTALASITVVSAPVLAASDTDRQNESRAHQLTTAVIICPIFAAVFAALRVYTRLFLIKVRFWEDLTVVFAWGCAVAMSVFMQFGVVYGNGRHFETISTSDLVEGVRVGIAVTQLYSLTHYFLKLSILLQYVRVSVMPSDKRLCYSLLALLNVGYLGFLVARMARCDPFRAQWTPGIPGARCFFSGTALMFASQIWNMGMDFVILLAPLYILRHFTGGLLQRVGIGLVLAFGASSCIVSVLRLQTLYQAAASADPSWDMVPCAIYALIEVNVGISCASVVTLRPLFRRLRQRISSISPSEEEKRKKNRASKEISQLTTAGVVLFSLQGAGNHSSGSDGMSLESLDSRGSSTRVRNSKNLNRGLGIGPRRDDQLETFMAKAAAETKVDDLRSDGPAV